MLFQWLQTWVMISWSPTNGNEKTINWLLLSPQIDFKGAMNFSKVFHFKSNYQDISNGIVNVWKIDHLNSWFQNMYKS